jgi:transposase-like protein
MPKRSPFVVRLSAAERSSLEGVARRYTAPYREVIRAKIVLMAALDLQNQEIARRLSLPTQIVSKWRKRFFHQRLPGLEELPRQGRPPVFSPQRRR